MIILFPFPNPAQTRLPLISFGLCLLMLSRQCRLLLLDLGLHNLSDKLPVSGINATHFLMEVCIMCALDVP